VTLAVCALGVSAAWAQAAEAYVLSVSTQSSRTSAATLGGQSYAQSSAIFVFVSPTTGVVSVKFYLDDPTRSGTPRRVELAAPYDFAGTASDGSAYGFSLNSLSAGSHTITAATLRTDGVTEVDSGSFTVAASSSTPSGTLVFQDNFDGTTLDTANWAPYDGAGHGGNGLRRPWALSVASGNLIMTGRMVDGKIVSGGMSHRHDQTYGRYEFRVRTDNDPTATMSGTVMTWPKYQWAPQFTETDMYETGHRTNRRPFNTFVHYGYTYSTQKQFSHDSDASQWHTIAMDWRSSALKMYRDGVLVWTLTDTAAIPDVMHHLNIQLDARANNWLTTPVRMYVDYVKIWR
jgi:hypothetical protein